MDEQKLKKQHEDGEEISPQILRKVVPEPKGADPFQTIDLLSHTLGHHLQKCLRGIDVHQECHHRIGIGLAVEHLE